MLTRNGFDAAFLPAVNAMVRAALDQPLGPPGLRLRDVDSRSCVRELDFVYACRHFVTADVRAALAHPSSGAHPLFVRAAGGLRDRDIRGFMIGTIDLLVQHEGRFYILDYKSNNLGSSRNTTVSRG